MSEVPTDEALVASVDVLPVAEGTSWTMLLVRLLMVAVSGLLTCPVTADEGGCHSATGPPDPQEEDSRGREGIQKRHRNAIPFNQRSPKRPPYSMPSATESPRGGEGRRGLSVPVQEQGKCFSAVKVEETLSVGPPSGSLAPSPVVPWPLVATDTP